MAFRDRNPNISLSYLTALEFKKQCPYDLPEVGLMLFVSPDDHTTFLASPGDFDDETGQSCLYLAEANPDCPMREAFEYGEISWSDYWDSRDGIIESHWSFPDDQAISAAYVSPQAIDMLTRFTHERRHSFGPLIVKRNLLMLWQRDEFYRQGRSLKSVTKELDQFMEKHGERLARAKMAA